MASSRMEITGPDEAVVRTTRSVPIEIRVLAAILAIDLVAGIWMRLHAESWLALFLTHLPVLGFAGLMWSFAPDSAKAWWHDHLRNGLGNRRVGWGLVGVGAALLIATFFCSSVHVESLEPGARTRLRLIAGDRVLADSAGLSGSASEPLNRLTSPVTFRPWFRVPIGRRMWVYGDHLATVSRWVFPWKPMRLQYPDDFDTLATLAILPMPMLASNLRRPPWPELTVRDALDTSVVLYRDSLRSLQGILIGYPEVSRPDSAVLAIWKDSARSQFRRASTLTDPVAADSAAAADTRDAHDRWRAAQVRHSTRPIVLRDTLIVELRAADGRMLKADSLRVNHAISHIMLQPAP